MHSQATTRKNRPSPRIRRSTEFIAAVRFCDGRRELFSVRNAFDLADARELVFCELPDAAAVVLAPRR